VQEILHDEWGYVLGDERVQVIDPATGTGNFLVHLLDRADDRYLDAFYRNSLFANEIMLMPYYIASLNIETTYGQRAGVYRPFEGLAFADTLDLTESRQISMFTERNTQRVMRQQRAPINIIIGNPPYNVGQNNENDNNKNRKYPVIDGRVQETYAKDGTATLKNKLYDPYVKFFRWATDRLGGRDGIVCMVTNNSFVDQIAFDGMRKHLLQDFTRVYHLDLHGNVRQNPKLSGTTHNVFGIQVGVGITVAIKSSKHTTPELYYHRVPETWTKVDKLSFLGEHVELQGRHNALNTIPWTRLAPNIRHDWLVPTERETFEEGIPVGTKDGKRHKSKINEVVFNLYSLGIVTSRDNWIYGFSTEAVARQMSKHIRHFNDELDRYRRDYSGDEPLDSFLNNDEAYIKWTDRLKQRLSIAKKRIVFDASKIRRSMYRPFTAQYVYLDDVLIQRRYQQHLIFPTPESERDNRVICVSSVGSEKDFYSFIVNIIPNLAFVGFGGGCQSFPFYTYDEDGGNRRENITDWALQEFQAQHGASVTKWDIFYYVYGVLHDPTYRTRFADNLKKDLPRIPILPNFTAYRDAGKRLATLHLDYEKQPRFRDLRWERRNDASGKPVALDYRVQKMKAISTEKHPDGYAIISAIQINPTLTITNIPPEASAYRSGNRSALEWIIDQYQVKTDKRSGITSDPNTYSDDERYIIELVERVVTVSVETVKTVAGLAEADSVG